MKDRTGMRYGKLTAISHFKTEKTVHSGTYYYITSWLFRCDCGNEVIKKVSAVTIGVGLSCAECAMVERKELMYRLAQERKLKNEIQYR